MKFCDFLWHFPEVELTDMQMAACRYLESRGLRFCIDFGYENAAALAWDRLEAECPTCGSIQ